MADFDPTSFIRFARRIATAALIIFGTLWLGCSVTTRIDAGHVGVKVKLVGSQRGVQDEPLTPGWHFFNPVTEQIILFPTNVQNVVWTHSPNEGRPIDESLNFSSSEGANISADFGLSFHVDQPMAPKLYNKFRQNDMIALANSYIRNTVREALNEVASKMKVEEIYGVGKTAMLKEVADRCRERLGTFGVSIDQLTINGALRLPPLIADAINRALEASQNAAQSRNRVAQVEAEARQAITQATGAAEAARLRAQGEGDAVIIRARAEAQANESIRLSMTPAMMQYRAIERWDGRMPMFQGGDKMPLLTFDAAKLDTLDEPTRQKRLKELFDSARPAPIPSAIPTIAPTSAPHFPVPVPSAVPAPR